MKKVLEDRICSFLLFTDTPDAPRDLEIPKFDRFSATLTWKEPTSDGGNPIQGKVFLYQRPL